MFKIEKKYRCIFCSEKHRTEASHYQNGHLSICQDCFDKLSFTPKPCLFSGTRNIDYLVSPFFYADKIRQIILDYKFNSFVAYGNFIAQLVRELICEFEHLSDFDYVIPVPLSKKRFNERGYNQSAPIAKAIAEQFSVPYSENILFKIRETERQSGIKIIDRMTNVKDAFEAREDLQGKRIILVDDIYTTGSTMTACADALKKMNASNIVGITFAYRKREENILNIMY